MCGIFGMTIGATATVVPLKTRRHVGELLELSASRGKEAVGLAIAGDELTIYKEPLSADRFVRTETYKKLVRELAAVVATRDRRQSISIVGHSRLVTDGGRELNRNNQPVVTRGVVGLHNGIVVNHAALWQRHAGLTRELEVDSEIIFALLRKHLDTGLSVEEACGKALGEIEGAASVAALFEDRQQLLLATNNGSLYYRCSPGQTLIFASERYILDTFVARNADIRTIVGSADTVAVEPGRGVVVDLTQVSTHAFSLSAPTSVSNGIGAIHRPIVDLSSHLPPPATRTRRAIDLSRLEERFPYRFPGLQRCSRCVLPYTMPYITFDGKGVCNYCHSYERIETRGRQALEDLLQAHKPSPGRPGCLVSVSGGRDSVYGLHLLKRELGIDVVSYTYDWGMVTDLARRNISRICGKLGIENILVSADIGRKRDNIRKNVEAWLRRPTLGTIPLFMAGDKAYFHHLKRVQAQTGAPIAFLCENLLERTNFKTGFAGIPPQVGNKEHTYSMRTSGKLGLARYFLGEFAKNRGYWNSSLLDTVGAFAIYYLRKRTDYNLYSFIRWREEEVVRVIRDEYDFEMSPDTETTWRIGDGTAAFYNYIYFTLAGFTENDTFRSNQIREGDLSRDEALALVERDNRYRLPSVKWYLDTIGLGEQMERVLETIHRAPKRYVE